MGSTQQAIESPRTVNAMVMRIVTKFETAEEFVHSFSRFCTENACFIPSAQAKRVGVETAFSIRLADGTPMLRGTCVVLDSYLDTDNTYGRPGVRLGLRKLTPESKLMFQHLRRAHGRTDATVRVEMPPEATQEDPQAKATVQMTPLFPEPMVTEEASAGEDDSGGIPEPIDAVDSLPPLETTVPARAPVMTLLGVAPLAPAPRPRPVAPRVSMVALSNEIRTTPAPRRGLVARLFGRVRAMFRKLRWAYRRRRSTRESVRRLPTST